MFFLFGRLLLGVAALGVSSFAAEANSEIVRMAPFKVKESTGVFEFDVRADEKTKVVQEVTVSWVSSWAHEKGLRIGDRLMSVDGKWVAGMSFEQMSELMKRKLREGESQKLFFTGRRLLGRPIKLTWTSRG